MDKLLDRFFNYVSFDTQAKANVKSVPSTEGQRKPALALQHELQALGFTLLRSAKLVQHRSSPASAMNHESTYALGP